MAGQIIKRGDKKWQIKVFLGRDAEGKRRYFSKTIRGTKKDAERFKTAKLREIDLGEFVQPNNRSVSDLVDEWINEVARNSVRQRTWEHYRWIGEKYLKMELGREPIDKLSTAKVQHYYNSLSDSGLAPKTVKHVHNVLSQAFKWAERCQMVKFNPCQHCSLPKQTRKEVRTLTQEERIRFRKAIKGHALEALFLVAIETGMRPGEYRALKWADLDLERRVIRVRRSVDTKGIRFSEPKTAKSKRQIPISEPLSMSLKSHRTAVLKHKFRLGPAYEDHDLVFPSAKGTAIEHHNLLNRHFKPLLKEAGLPLIRLYDLRHTLATLMLENGMNPKIVSERLGHSGIILTLDTYSHVLPTMQEAASEEIGSILYGEDSDDIKCVRTK